MIPGMASITDLDALVRRQEAEGQDDGFPAEAEFRLGVDAFRGTESRVFRAV